MPSNAEIENLQQQINELSKSLEHSRQQLSSLQQQLNSLYQKEDLSASKVTTQQLNSLKQKTSATHSLENFIGLNVIQFVGIIVLLIGISIGVKYAIDKNLITSLSRIVLAYSAAIGLYILSLILRKNYIGLSAILFSGAMAAAYFTTYGAFVYYNFFAETIAFIIMVVLALFTAFEALQYNRQEIALLGMVGAYAIPLLISSNHENYVLLFSYILVMNVGLLLIAFKRSWKVVDMLATCITWIFFSAWLLLKFKDAFKFYALVFLFVYYVIFLINSFAFSSIKKIPFKQRQLIQMLINNAALYGCLLLIFKATDNKAIAANITAVCCLLFLVYAIAGNKYFHNEKLLNRMHYTEAIILSVLFVAIKFGGLMITFSWMLIAVIVFVFGIYTKTIWPRLAALILLGFTLLKLIVVDSLFFSAVQKIIAYLSIGTLLLVLSFFYQKFKKILFEQDVTD